MRVDFTNALKSILEQDPQSVLITGDLGYSAFEEIKKKYGPRFLNAGVAEQNMVGLAAGIALSGYKPWIYSIAPFMTLRCLEQIRNDACFHNLPVRIVGNGGGYTYGIMGSTHHALEDLAALKALPNMSLFFPCSNDHVKPAVEIIGQMQSPSYLRLAVSAFTTAATPLSQNAKTLTRHYRAGEQLTIVGVGHGVQPILAALEKTGLGKADVAVFGIARFPFDLEADKNLSESIKKSGKVLVVEEHYRNGGMGESLKAALPSVEAFEIMAATHFNGQLYGSAAFHLKQCGLTPEDIAKKAEQMLGTQKDIAYAA